MSGIAQWLDGLGLGRYASLFADNAIDAEVLPTLTAADLRDLGIASVGHRRKPGLSFVVRYKLLSSEVVLEAECFDEFLTATRDVAGVAISVDALQVRLDRCVLLADRIP